MGEEIEREKSRREQRMLEHPTRYSVERVLRAAAGIAVPLVALWLVAQLVKAIPLPDLTLPRLPNVDLPTVIDLPEIDLPTIIDLPDAPAWMERYAGLIGLALPLIVALVASRREIARRRRAHAAAAKAGVPAGASERPSAAPYDQDADTGAPSS